MDSDSTDESQEELDVGTEDQPGLDPDELNAEDEIEDGIDEPSDSQDQSTGDHHGPKSSKTTNDGAALKLPALPVVRPEAVAASVYDIVPTIAAPHSTSINAVTSTPDLRWVFSGGSDGYIRKFNWIETANGKSMLTVAQRHPFVDSVTKAGVLVNYWENSDGSSGKQQDDGSQTSAVYSLAVQRNALWLLAGTESGAINIQSVRHEEGKRIALLQGHTSAISVLNVAADEHSVLSGSWDKTVVDWDLNTGNPIRTYTGSNGQISALETRPSSTLPVPEFLESTYGSKGTIATNNEEAIRKGDEPATAVRLGDTQEQLSDPHMVNGEAASPPDSLFGDTGADSLFGENETMGPSGEAQFEYDETDFSRAMANNLPAPGSNETKETLEAVSGENETDPMDASKDDNETIATDIMPNPALGELDLSEIPRQGQHNLHMDDTAMLSGLEEPASEPQSLPNAPETLTESASSADSTFLAASIDGSLRIWDKRKPSPVAKIMPQHVPPWCMNASWSPDGNYIYAGRRNGTIDEYSLHAGFRKPARNFRLPANSGAVSALKVMPNGRHLLCASFDILRLYDLQEQQIFKHATVPFLIVPGHRTSIVSQLYIDPSCRYLISAAGNRGWEGATSEVLLGYEIIVPKSD